VPPTRLPGFDRYTCYASAMFAAIDGPDWRAKAIGHLTVAMAHVATHAIARQAERHLSR